MTPEVIKTLEQGLEKRLSPEQIIGRSEVENTPMPCIQTAYNYIHKQRKKGRLLHKKLRHRGRKRKARGQSTKTRGTIPGRRDISERPPEVEKRQRFGDFECDLVIGAEHSGALLTINERATGLLWMLKLKDKQASSVREGIISLLRPIKDRVYTITSDNGKEFASHREISEVLECEYYFARPYHSWERGSNENLNGLIRDYFPKKTTFYDITPSAVKTVQEALNNRPRKRYKFLPPTEFYTQNFNQLDTRCVCN
jgi:IS30 family transposase